MTNRLNPNYVIGDIHGRVDLLEAILSFCRSDAAKRGRAPKFTFLGDIVDRGNASQRALDIVCRTLEESDDNVLLLGNHDDWFLKSIEQDNYIDLQRWLYHGGAYTLYSYGHDDFEEARRDIPKRFPDHMSAIRNAHHVFEDDTFVYAHAGIDPTVSVKDVDDSSIFFWVREHFLHFVGKLEKPVIHGHTICDSGLPEVTENRISIDTGSYCNGRLTALVIDPVEQSLSFHQTDGSAASVIEVQPLRIDRGLGTVLDDIPALFGSRSTSTAA